jgi:hypothetical protein
MRKQITRRHLLRGVGGALIALPFLEAMTASSALGAAGKQIPNRSTWNFYPKVFPFQSPRHLRITTNAATFTSLATQFSRTATYRATLNGAGNISSRALTANSVVDFFFLNGDLNHDGQVSISDFLAWLPTSTRLLPLGLLGI